MASCRRNPRRRKTKIRNDEKGSKDWIHQGRSQNVRMNLAGHIQDDYRHCVNELFENGYWHKRSVAKRILRDENKHQLPQECHAQKSVVELRMRDWRWRVSTDLFNQKIQRRKGNKTIGGCNAKNDPANLIFSSEFFCLRALVAGRPSTPAHLD